MCQVDVGRRATTNRLWCANVDAGQKVIVARRVQNYQAYKD